MRLASSLNAALLVVAGVGTALAAPPLTLRDAIDDAIHNNLQVLLATAGRAEAAGNQVEARGALLPQLSADLGQSRQQVNLAAQGISFPGVPSTVTFNSFQARVQLRQSLIDVSAWQQYAGAKVASAVAASRERLAREQIAAQTALNFVEVLRTRQAVAAARADLQLARSLAQLARDRHDAGTANGVDVARADTALSQRKVRLAQAHTDRARAQLQLARIAGLPLGQPREPAGSLKLATVAPPDVDTAIHDALVQRPELELAIRRERAMHHQLAAARAQRLPSLALTGAYGDTGNTLRRNNEETYRVGAEVQIPIFAGGSISGRVDAATSRVDQARLRMLDTRQQIEQDVRLALRTLDTSAARVRAATDNRNLAERELQLSRDRFSAGVANNIEVVDAQASLANARDGLVAAQAQYADARVNLAAALGTAQSIDFSRNSP